MLRLVCSSEEKVSLLKTSDSIPTGCGTASDLAIEACSVDKCYRLYGSHKQKIAAALGLGWLFPNSSPIAKFPALRDVNFQIRRGEKVGIIGRNGAGKSTLLKLVSGHMHPSAGTLTVNGCVQMLMFVGLGFHPEFTGIENIRASILYNGLPFESHAQVEADIIEFAELGDFLFQPLRTYSLGMQSRLQFACATAIAPDVLVVDEVLAAGDSYFLGKCNERIKRLTSSGCTLVMVSHSTQQINEFCDRAIWLEKGRITSDGNVGDVIETYESFIAGFDVNR